MSELNYPDLELTDMYGEKVRLSKVAEGKVVLLDFWSAELARAMRSTPILKELYAE